MKSFHKNAIIVAESVSVMAGINLFYNFKNNYEKKKQDLIKRNYDEIYSHELAHKSAGGSLAGAIVIERNADGIPVGGHVPIKMPALDKNNPDKTINDANTVIRSAMAPTNPSSQDYNAANQAKALKLQAMAVKAENTGKRLDIKA